MPKKNGDPTAQEKRAAEAEAKRTDWFLNYGLDDHRQTPAFWKTICDVAREFGQLPQTTKDATSYYSRRQPKPPPAQYRMLTLRCYTHVKTFREVQKGKHSALATAYRYIPADQPYADLIKIGPEGTGGVAAVQYLPQPAPTDWGEPNIRFPPHHRIFRCAFWIKTTEPVTSWTGNVRTESMKVFSNLVLADLLLDAGPFNSWGEPWIDYRDPAEVEAWRIKKAEREAENAARNARWAAQRAADEAAAAAAPDMDLTYVCEACGTEWDGPDDEDPHCPQCGHPDEPAPDAHLDEYGDSDEDAA